jgi:DNA-binding MarR family transcriptional regulator/catechol 2,3-dioxygenase-like lactoylglutathione lyase family enzyme
LTSNPLVGILDRMSGLDREQYATPTLMRSARGVYAQSIRAHLHAIGIDDLPRNGVFILTGIDTSGGPRPDLTSELGVTKQAVSQVVDILVNQGYLERGPDPDDRRRVALKLTERGAQVVEASVRAVDEVDHLLSQRVAPEQVAAMRAALIALTEIKVEAVAAGTSRRHPPGRLLRFSPIFPVRDLAAALAHYGSLGFTTLAYESGTDYGFANRDSVSLHLVADHDHDDHDHDHDHEHGHPASAYLYVRDADVLYEQWSRPGIAGRSHPVMPTPYGMREGSHVDPDGNLIRFGSPIED